MSDFLHVAVAGGPRTTVAAGESIVIGRGVDADLLLDDERTSRAHARVERVDEKWVVTDLGSANGTTNAFGEKISALEVAAPMALWLGGAEGTRLDFTPVESTSSRTYAFDELPGSSRVHDAAGGAVVRVGRAGDNDIIIDDLLVSRHHAEIQMFDDEMEIRDLRSSNGTYVDGQRVSSVRASSGSVVSIGRTNFVIQGATLVEQQATELLEFRVDGLAVADRRGRALIRDVSFEVAPGSLVGILGPSGAGKSTVMKAIVGAVPASAGTVNYGGIDLLAGLGSTRRSIGYVPQDDILHSNLTIDRSLYYAAKLRLAADTSDDEIEGRITEVLANLGLSEHRHKKIEQLSGGQRKRASTAMELITRPPLLLLDEPSSGLDPGNEKSLMELLAGLAHEQPTGDATSARRVMVVTHSVQSLELCDQLIVLCPGFEHIPGGRIAYDGPPSGLTAHFGVDDAAEVFRLLERRDRDWGTYAAQLRTARMEAEGLDSVPEFRGGGQHHLKSSRDRAQLTWRGQLDLLTRRYSEVVRADRANLTLIALQAPIIGLMLAMITERAFDRPASRPSTTLMVLLLGLVLSITYIGASNSIREIVKERAIYDRERALGMLPVAYVGSKFIVLASITFTQAFVLTFIATRTAGPIPAENLLGDLTVSPFVELLLVIVLTGIAATCLGLLISALVSSADKATSILPVVLLAMYLLSGGPTPVDQSPALGPVSIVNSARWGLTASAKVVDAEFLLQCDGDTQADPTAGDRCRDSWERESGGAWASITMLIVLGAGSVGGAVWVLNRRSLADIR